MHLHVHRLEFVHEEIFLNLEFLALNGDTSHLFVLIDELVPCGIKFLFTLIDFSHIRTGLEGVFL